MPISVFASALYMSKSGVMVCRKVPAYMAYAIVAAQLSVLVLNLKKIQLYFIWNIISVLEHTLFRKTKSEVSGSHGRDLVHE
jgi:hypothetical protein